MDLAEFRTKLRVWLEANCPPSMRTPMPAKEEPQGGLREPAVNPDTTLWLERCAEQGFTLPEVPKEYGGAGLNPEQALAYFEEMKLFGARWPVVGVGPAMLAPTLMKHGTEEQKRTFLPRIARGEDRWAQGFSEPGAGSDLASLRLQAVREGDEYVLNGQKIWTSWGNVSDWIITLARTATNPSVRQWGITFLLVPLNTPGITVRPLRLISGESEFCETFFDNVRVPVSRRIGAENEGWGVTKDFLIADRLAIRRWCDGIEAMNLEELWRESAGDPAIAEAILDSELDELGARCFRAHIEREESRGSSPDVYSNVLKYWQMEHVKRRHELATLLLDHRGIGWAGDIHSEADHEATVQWLRARSFTIGGGTSEIQLNIIAKSALQLPSR